MAITAVDIHLKRASGFVDEVEKALQEFRSRVKAHDDAVDQIGDSDGMAGFLAEMAAGWMSKGRIKRNHASLVSDLDLAMKELELAEKSDPNGQLVEGPLTLTIPNLRAAIHELRGEVEMAWGKFEIAREHLQRAIDSVETPYSHFMMGLLYEEEYKPKEALPHFERCIALDPAGEYSVPALREANAMKNYKKRFRGSWGTFGLLLFIWPAAIIYFFVKRK